VGTCKRIKTNKCMHVRVIELSIYELRINTNLTASLTSHMFNSLHMLRDAGVAMVSLLVYTRHIYIEKVYQMEEGQSATTY